MKTTEELIALSQDGDMNAKETLVTQNAGLIWSVAKRFMGRGVEPDDLYQLACMGFIKAIDGFDLMYGTQFSTYAVPKIAGEIRRYIRDDGAVKVSRGIKEKATVIKTAKNQLIHALGREPTVNEVSKQTGFTAEEIAVAESATATIESIQQDSGENGFSLESILSNTQTEDAFLEKIALRQAISKLQHREAMVIRLRYFHGMTQDRVSKVLDVSQVQVSRIEKKALSRLRELLT